MATPHTSEREPSWWITEYTVLWQDAEPELRSEFEQRLRDQEKKQGPDDAVFGRDDTPRNVDVDDANRVPDESWETTMSWDDARAGLRFGIGAREKYQDHAGWSDDLEQKLRGEWDATQHPTLWERVKRAVRHGFEHKRGEQS